MAEKESIESIFGGELEWQGLQDSRACWIRKIIEGGYRSPSEEWPGIFERLVDALIHLDKALKPYIQKLSV
jgi:hypothetical protein